jgi:hypothetical protein
MGCSNCQKHKVPEKQKTVLSVKDFIKRIKQQQKDQIKNGTTNNK